MTNEMTTRIQRGIATALAVLLTLFQSLPARAEVLIPVSVNLGGINQVLPQIDEANTKLKKWRTGVANQAPQPAAAMSIQFYVKGNKTQPDRTNVLDNTANNQNSLRTDNVIEMPVLAKGNLANQAILLFTDTADFGTDDPLYQIQLRGGLRGAWPDNFPTNKYDPNRSIILPLAWTAVSKENCMAASGADITVANSVPAGSALLMPSQVDNPSVDPVCPAEGPTPAGHSRGTAGFCGMNRTINNVVQYVDEGRTHFVIDKQNMTHITGQRVANRWHQNYGAGEEDLRMGAWRYASVLNNFGVSTTETATGFGVGGATPNLVELLLSVNVANVTPSTFGNIIHLDRYVL